MMPACRICLTGLILAAALACAASAQPDLDPYLEQTPRVSDVDPQQTEALRHRLAAEVQKVLDRGMLAPLCLAYGDIPGQAVWLYTEPGRIITSMAYAYPHLPADMQPEVIEYVRAMLSNPNEQPWRPTLKKHGEGAPRELHGETIPANPKWFPDEDEWPRLHTYYGLWLYGDRTEDWSTVRRHWQQIKEGYRELVEHPNLIHYGQLSGHIAMARLAERFNDREMAATVRKFIERDFNAAMDPEKIAERQDETFFGLYTGRVSRSTTFSPYFPGQPWMFLNASPEVMRFIADHVRESAVQRIEQFTDRYPIWWLAQSPYFTRWTGDESIGLATPQAMGMMFPFHRWLLDTEPQQLRMFMRSSPTGIGDAHWMDAAVWAIESTGDTRWQPIEP
jgi:hypothetical protein